ncbi:hypothetical protein [Georgenia sp. SYP-B2076]|uniref:hypothetical protein n=1 Tax=Georgenia sp. SYP-B2076 TaxID=2495881 RepID=UPI001F0C5463|nr:hypothetical protein [Georgenia sp. SYP-B2076]
MELASFLAGERWSDHPSCTHPLLAHLARLVNDFTSDAARPRLAPLIPSVIGLRSADPRWGHEIALLAATTALPLAREPRRPTLAVGILSCERLLAAEEGRTLGSLRPGSQQALEQAPEAARWAREFADRIGSSHARNHPGPAILECAVPAIADARGSDADQYLFDLLVAAVALCQDLAGREVKPEADLAVDRRLEQFAPAARR